MHTAAFSLGYGLPIGQSDFYMNYGRSQPGCYPDLLGICAHNRAPLYFAESINHPNFFAKRCGSYKEIDGENCKNQSPQTKYNMRPVDSNHKLKGVFWVGTNSAPLYGKGRL